MRLCWRSSCVHSAGLILWHYHFKVQKFCSTTSLLFQVRHMVQSVRELQLFCSFSFIDLIFDLCLIRRGSVFSRGHVGAGGDDQRSGAARTGEWAHWVVNLWPPTESRFTSDPSPPCFSCLREGIELRQQHRPPIGPPVEHGRRGGTSTTSHVS